jgi:hypothetical protein
LSLINHGLKSEKYFQIKSINFGASMNFEVNRAKDKFITSIYIDPLIFVMICIIVVKPISKGNIGYGNNCLVVIGVFLKSV